MDSEQEFIGGSLHWFIRKGNLIILLMLLAFLFFCWLIKYPDSIKSKARIYSLELPESVQAKTNGRLDSLSVKNGEQVQKNQPLGFIESIGNREEILQLKQWLDTTMPIFSDPAFELRKIKQIPDFKNLGELQSAFQNFQDDWKTWLQTFYGGYYEQQIKSIRRDMGQVLQLKNNLETQIQFQRSQLELSEKELKAYEDLARDKIIAPLELDQYKTQVIRNKQSLKQISSQTISTQLNYEAKEKELIEMEERKRQLNQACLSSGLELKVNIEQWMEKFSLLAPKTGIISFAGSITENTAVTSGQTIFYIDNTSSTFYAELNVSQSGFGKIMPGQKVILKPVGFPVEEFGSLNGKVSEISSFPDKEDNFQIKISIPSNHTKIRLQNGLVAEAEIITNERRLLERLIGQLSLLFN